jgi:hypothetical protein
MDFYDLFQRTIVAESAFYIDEKRSKNKDSCHAAPLIGAIIKIEEEAWGERK